jgi:hypothetical protein
MDNNDKSASQSTGGFWTTLPGVLTGIAGVIGAITALILGLKEAGIIGQTPSPSPTPSVNVNTPTSSLVPSTALPPTPPPTSSSPSQSNPRWEFMGSAVTGETVSVDSSSINKSGGTVNFTYKIGNDKITARADCNDNKWYADGYGWQSPKSKTTQDMLNYVCKF